MSEPQDGVVLLHGIFRTHRSMAKLARFLQSQGYAVLNVGYPSTRLSIEQIAEHLHPRISEFADSISGKLHIVGYSMGGLITRAYIHRYRPEKLGRVVMLGTPNGGSEVADFLKGWWIYRKCYGPAGQQLITDQQQFAALYGPVDYALGILAGTRSVDPLSKRIIGKPSDGKVSVESSKLDGAADHLELPVSHTFFPSRRFVWEQVAHFLKQGAFRR